MDSPKLKYTYMAKGKYPRFRHPTTGEVPLPGLPGDDIFLIRYGEMLAKVVEAAARSGEHDGLTFRWLATNWMRSKEFAALKPSTQETYRLSIEDACKELGAEPYALITRKMVKTVRNSLSETPRKAQKMKEAVSSMYTWAGEEELVEDDFNPGKGFKKLKGRGGSYSAWTDEELELVLRNAPPALSTLLLLSVYTGQRACDVVLFDWTKIQGNTIRVRQEKTDTELIIPCHPRLRAHLDELRTSGHNSGIVALTMEGKPFSAAYYRQVLRRLIRKIPNMPRRTPHGLRYTAAAKLEAAGCTVAQISAILGHHTYKMALHYLTQRHDAEAAMRTLQEHEARQIAA